MGDFVKDQEQRLQEIKGMLWKSCQETDGGVLFTEKSLADLPAFAHSHFRTVGRGIEMEWRYADPQSGASFAGGGKLWSAHDVHKLRKKPFHGFMKVFSEFDAALTANLSPVNKIAADSQVFFHPDDPEHLYLILYGKHLLTLNLELSHYLDAFQACLGRHLWELDFVQPSSLAPLNLVTLQPQLTSAQLPRLKWAEAAPRSFSANEWTPWQTRRQVIEAEFFRRFEENDDCRYDEYPPSSEWMLNRILSLNGDTFHSELFLTWAVLGHLGADWTSDWEGPNARQCFQFYSGEDAWGGCFPDWLKENFTFNSYTMMGWNPQKEKSEFYQQFHSLRPWYSDGEYSIHFRQQGSNCDLFLFNERQGELMELTKSLGTITDAFIAAIPAGDFIDELYE